VCVCVWVGGREWGGVCVLEGVEWVVGGGGVIEGVGGFYTSH